MNVGQPSNRLTKLLQSDSTHQQQTTEVVSGLGNCVTRAWSGQPREEVGDGSAGCKGTVVELRGEPLMGVAVRLEPKGTGDGVVSLDFLRGADNRGVWNCWGTDGGS